MTNEETNTQNDMEVAAFQDAMASLNSLNNESTIRDYLIDELYGTDFVSLVKKGDEAFSNGYYQEALQLYINAHNLANNSGRFSFIAASFMSSKIANVYIKLGMYESAFISYDRAKGLIQTEKNIEQGIDLTSQQRNKKDKGIVVIVFIIAILWLLLLYGGVFLDPSHGFSPLVTFTVAELMLLLCWAFAFSIGTGLSFRKKK